MPCSTVLISVHKSIYSSLKHLPMFTWSISIYWLFSKDAWSDHYKFDQETDYQCSYCSPCSWQKKKGPLIWPLSWGKWPLMWTCLEGSNMHSAFASCRCKQPFLPPLTLGQPTQEMQLYFTDECFWNTVYKHHSEILHSSMQVSFI